MKLAIIFLIAIVDMVMGTSRGFKLGQRFNYSDAMIRQSNSQAQIFSQVLDHFDSGNQATWSQRYWINDEFFDGSGPVFLVIAGEYEENGGLIFYDGLPHQLAGELGALLVNLEHRFYGKSRPTSDASTENLRFLSKDQALADLVSFRNFIHSSYQLSDNNKWLTIGGSYPGDLSAWARLKYPDSFYAAWSSSAPIRDRLDYDGYNKILGSSLSAINPQCASVFGQAMAAVNNLASSTDGLNQLNQIFNSCEDVKDPKILLEFYSDLVNKWAGGIQYYPGGKPTIDTLCSSMLDSSLGDPIHRLANIVRSDASSCLPDSYDSDVYWTSKSDWDNVASAEYHRIWFHQQCFELGVFQTSSPSDYPFSANVPLSFFTGLCASIFSNFDLGRLQSSIQNNIQNFGGQNYQGTRVVFSNGQLDPWSGPGYFDAPPNSQTRIVYIKGASHCADFAGYNEYNSDELNQGVAQIKQYLREFLGM